MTNQADQDRARKAPEPAAPVPPSQREQVILSLIVRPEAETSTSRP